mgnify:CR=1 FL=1
MAGRHHDSKLIGSRLLGVIVIAWNLRRCERAGRAERLRLRAMQRLLARYPPEPSYESPSPHQLLGDIARPLRPGKGWGSFR